ncbi:hypothetical protein JCM6882_002239 [Rhodosporidiobolus microsporus]
MTDSPSAASLQALLRNTSASPNSPSSSSSTLPGRATQTVKAPPNKSQAGWGETLSAAFGYGTAATARGAGGGGGGKGKGRAGLPDWGTHDEQSGAGDGEEKRLGDEAQDELDELADSILWQAGTDHASSPGPLLVIACSRIPPQSDVSHPNLLTKLRLRLEAFASSGPYSVVLLVNPTPHAPATAQLVSTYLSLTRTARKNVRRIWVVGGGWWTRVILTVFSSTLLSAKTAQKRKIVQCASLSSLAAEMGAEAFVQVEFPLEVYSANATSDPEIKLPPSSPPLQRTFGVPLEELTGKDGSRLPPIVRDCVDVLLCQGPASVGIFRRSPSASTVKILEGAYDRGHPVLLSALPDAPYLAASLLKLFVRSLPAPIFPPSLYPIARACPLMDEQALPHVRAKVLPTLAPPALLLLQQLLRVLSAVSSNSPTNLMTSDNLVICLCPALIGGLGASREEVEMCRVPGMEVGSMRGLKSVKESGRNTLGGVLRVMIDHYDDLFDPSFLSTLSPTRRLPLISTEIDLSPQHPSFPSGSIPLSSATQPVPTSPSSRTGSLHSAPRSPIASIPEDEETEQQQPAVGSSPPSTFAQAQKMARSTSISSVASSSSAAPSFTSAASVPSSPVRAATLKLSEGGTVRLGKGARSGGGRGVVTVQEVEGMFVGPAGEGEGKKEEGGAEAEAEE